MTKKRRHRKKGKHWARGALETQAKPARKYRKKVSVIMQSYGVSSPIEFDPLTPSDASQTGEDRKHTSPTITHVKNGKKQGNFEIPKRISGDGVTIMPSGQYRDEEGQIVHVWDDDDESGVIERFPIRPKGHTTKIEFQCPVCGATNYIHKCKD